MKLVYVSFSLELSTTIITKIKVDLQPNERKGRKTKLLQFFFKKRKRKEHTKYGEGEFEDNKSCGAEKEEKLVRKGRGQRVCVFMSLREKSDVPTKSK